MYYKRIYLNCLFAVLACIIFQSCKSVGIKGSGQSFTFIQLSDPQFGFLSDKKDGLQREIAHYEKAVSAVNQLKPDFVVITGDFVHHPRDTNELAIFKRITRKIDASIPVYYVPGNHDVGNHPTADDISFYKGNYGDDKFSFHHKGVNFIGLNSNIIKGASVELERQQLVWLTKELKKGKKNGATIVFTHHPVFLVKPDEADDEYFNLPKSTRLKYLELFEANNVKAIFAGHYHKNSYGKYNDMEMITTSAIGVPFEGSFGFQVIQVKDKAITHKFYPLE